MSKNKGTRVRSKQGTRPRIVLDDSTESLSAIAPAYEKADSKRGTVLTAESESRKSGTERKGLTGKLQSLLPICISAMSLIVAASAYQRSGDTALKQLRSYVGVEQLTVAVKSPSGTQLPSIKPGAIVKDTVEFKLQNYGATPALKTRLWANWQREEFAHQLPGNFEYQDKESSVPKGLDLIYSQAVIFPHTSWETPVAILDTTAFQDAQAGKSTLFLYGHVDYEDIYGDKHQTTFCYAYQVVDGKQVFVPYSKHNDAN